MKAPPRQSSTLMNHSSAIDTAMAIEAKNEVRNCAPHKVMLGAVSLHRAHQSLACGATPAAGQLGLLPCKPNAHVRWSRLKLDMVTSMMVPRAALLT